MRADIVLAAGQLLLEEGMTGFTIEGVAARAGASKTTIYKWWPSRGALALDGYAHAVEDSLTFPQTGVTITDLQTQLRSFIRLVTQTAAGRVITELIGAAQTDSALADNLHRLYTGPRQAAAVEVIERGKAKGELRADLDAATVVAQLWGSCYYRMLVTGAPLTQDVADELVRNLQLGIER